MSAAVFCLLAPTRLASQTLAARPTIDEAVAYALRSNPDVRIARWQIDSARGDARAARAIPNPAFTVAPGVPFQYSFNQPIDVGPNRTFRTRAAGQGVAAVRFDEQNVVRQTVFGVRQAFLDLLLVEAIRGVAFEQDTIVRRLLVSDSIRFSEGDLAARDLATTELQAAHAAATLARADAGVRAARISLQVLMGVSHPDTSFRVSGTLEYRELRVPVDSLRKDALAMRPDVAAADERVGQSESLRRLASSLAVPIPGVAAVYQPQPFGSGAHYAVGVSLTVPTFNWFAGERERAAAGLASAQENRRKTIATVEGDVVTASDALRAAQSLASRYASGLLEKARATLQMQRFAYENGHASLLELLNAVSAFGDTRTDYYTAVHDYLLAAYAIDRAVGRDVVRDPAP
jgi:cobalt-zinc-cadmium efflux system outer membrane protein